MLPLYVFASIYNGYAQVDIRQKIKGENSLSKQFTKLQANEQVFFNPANARKAFGLPANADLVLIRKETDKIGFTHYRYYQTYHTIPVENSMYIAHTSGGRLTSMGGAIITQFESKISRGTAATVSPAGAIKAAMKYVQAEKYAWQDADFEQRIKLRKGNTATYYPVPSKVWYGGDAAIEADQLTLAYKIDIYTLKPFDRKFIYVDVKTGKVLGSKQEMMHSDTTGTAATGYSGTQIIHSDLNNSKYRLRDLTKGNGIITLHASGSHADYTSTSPNWSFNTADKWALDAHFGVAATWTFYKNVFNRNSVDNAGFALVSWVNDASITNNAYWDGSEMDFGNLASNGKGVTAIDITGHELTHGVTQFTSNLVYSKEPGAINESLSDIMGKSVQFYTKPTDTSWILSNDMGWAIRSFSNPNVAGQPDTYKGDFWATEAPDNYGVHINSGVGNYMFYLLVKGGSGKNDIGNNYSVKGIGLAKADQIIYRTQTVYLTSTSNYADWRIASVNAAADLYGVTSNEVIQVENAWHAVGIGARGDSSCNLAPPDSILAESVTDISATVTWDTVYAAKGYLLEWKPASASTFFIDTILTSSASFNFTDLTAGTFYQVQISSLCSGGGNGIFSTVDSFKTTGTAMVDYCASAGKTVDGITNVTFNTINNTTSATTSGYTDYTETQSTTIIRGATYNLSARIYTGGDFTNYTKAWIDWNHDGIFSTIEEEYNLGAAKNVGDGPTAFSPVSVAVPPQAVTGVTRMRVSSQYNAEPLPCSASFDGEVEDYSVLIVAAGVPLCSTPSGLSFSAINNTAIIANWMAVPGATGYNVQYRVAGTTTWFKVFSKATSADIIGLASGTKYQLRLASLCSGSVTSAYSSPVFFTTGAGITYCLSKGVTKYEYIKTVVLEEINHTVTNAGGGYGDYTNLTGNLVAGLPYTIRLTPGFSGGSYSEYYTVYIDYNKDGILNGAGEVVAKGKGTGTGARSLSFTVPVTAKNGNTRIRIQMNYGSASTNPCAALTHGDVHDYTLNITGGSGLDTPESIAGTTTAGAVKRIQVYPNPITGTTATLRYHLIKDGHVTLHVVDMPGRALQNINIGKQKRGFYTYSMPAIKELANGGYFIVLYLNNELIGRSKVIVSGK